MVSGCQVHRRQSSTTGLTTSYQGQGHCAAVARSPASLISGSLHPSITTSHSTGWPRPCPAPGHILRDLRHGAQDSTALKGEEDRPLVRGSEGGATQGDGEQRRRAGAGEPRSFLQGEFWSVALPGRRHSWREAQEGQGGELGLLQGACVSAQRHPLAPRRARALEDSPGLLTQKET